MSIGVLLSEPCPYCDDPNLLALDHGTGGSWCAACMLPLHRPATRHDRRQAARYFVREARLWARQAARA